MVKASGGKKKCGPADVPWLCLVQGSAHLPRSTLLRQPCLQRQPEEAFCGHRGRLAVDPLLGPPVLSTTQAGEEGFMVSAYLLAAMPLKPPAIGIGVNLSSSH